jgi:hexosaminidase
MYGDGGQKGYRRRFLHPALVYFAQLSVIRKSYSEHPEKYNPSLSDPMNKLFPLSLILFGVLLLAGCNRSGNVSKEQAEKIGVSWKLVSNFTEPDGTFKAQFTIRNGSDFTLDGSNWKLFWNMSPRPIQSNKTPQPAVIEHINGDWYQMVPAKDFIMRPRDSMTITYTGTEGVVKETDAPLGLYFVFYDQEGKEKDIVQVADFKIEPFLPKNRFCAVKWI